MPAKRMSRVVESGTVKMGNVVSQMRARGEKVLSFNMGEPDFRTPDHIVAAAKQALDEGFTHYTPSNGIPELREAIAQHERECGVDAKAENVMVTLTKHAIFMTMLALVNDGDEVLLPEPAFVSYEPCIALAGGKAVPMTMTAENGFQLTPEMVQEKLTKKTKLLVLNSPSNPTGAVFKRENLKGIAEVCNDAKLNVFSDEIYKKLIYDGEHVSIASFDGMAERTVIADGFSKPYAMTGWRVGCKCRVGRTMALAFFRRWRCSCAAARPACAQGGAANCIRARCGSTARSVSSPNRPGPRTTPARG